MKIERTQKRIDKINRVLAKRQISLTAVFENINDVHNLSACLRTCDSVGIMEVHCVYYGEQPFPKLGEKSSASAKKWINIIKHKSIQACYYELRKEGKKIYTTHLSKDAVSVYNLNLVEPVALVFGNEHSGVSEEAVELADGNFLVPQVGMIQSLNISVACAVSLYEAFRQKMNAGLYESIQLPDELFNLYLDEWQKK